MFMFYSHKGSLTLGNAAIFENITGYVQKTSKYDFDHDFYILVEPLSSTSSFKITAKASKHAPL